MKLFTFFLLSVCIYSGVNAQNSTPVPIQFDKISENLYQILGGRGASAGVYIGDDAVLVIDSKMDKVSVDGILSSIAEITNKPIKWLVNTHSDGDHINGNQFFPKEVTIVAHENCRKEFLLPNRDGSPSNWANEELMPFVPEIVFTDQMKIYLGSKVVEMYYFGVGHTTGDIVVYFPEEKTAFIGDQVFWGRPQLIHSYKGGNSFEHVKTTQKLLSLDIEKYCSGHSEIKSRADVISHLEEFTQFQEKVKTLVKNGKSLAETKAAFNENEGRLVESVYNEIKAMN
jgi:glyoxylase-like metal-dependent hydrolase (beta-lactamase superfamily II)